MFREVPLSIWMLWVKDDIIILAKAVGEDPKKHQMMKPLQCETCEGFSIAKKYVPRGYEIPIGSIGAWER